MNKVLIHKGFLTRHPNWLLKSGTTILVLFFVVLICLSFILKYNEVIDAKIIVTGIEPPVDIYSKKDGKLIYSNFKSGAIVENNKILGVIENPSNYEHIFYLREKLADSLRLYEKVGDIYKNFPSDLELEYTIHLSYQRFLKAFQNYILYLNLNQEKLENLNINSRIERTKEQIRIKQRRFSNIESDLKLVTKENERLKKLFDKGVISQQQLEKSERNLLNVKNELNKVGEDLEILFIDTLSLKNLSAKSFNENLTNAADYYSDLQLSKQELKGKLDQWEEEYALVSPVSGKISVFDVWSNYQSLKIGEHVLTIVPDNKNGLIGKCQVPIKNSGKLRIGQEVNIKLESYPYHEWGLLKGKVAGISDIPKKGDILYYVVFINIPNLKTSYGKIIDFKQEMSGDAKIVLEKTSLIERVFYQFKGLWTDVSI